MVGSPVEAPPGDPADDAHLAPGVSARNIPQTWVISTPHIAGMFLGGQFEHNGRHVE